MDETQHGRVRRRNVYRALTAERTLVQDAERQTLGGVIDIRPQGVLIAAQTIRRIPLADIEPNGERISWVAPSRAYPLSIPQSNFLGGRHECELPLRLLKG